MATEVWQIQFLSKLTLTVIGDLFLFKACCDASGTSEIKASGPADHLQNFCKILTMMARRQQRPSRFRLHPRVNIVKL